LERVLVHSARRVSYRSAGASAGVEMNLDMTGIRVVRKGQVVCYGGLRIRVERVRLGTLWGKAIDGWGRETSRDEMVPCRMVSVVSS
jgi:hypothetical protein